MGHPLSRHYHFNACCCFPFLHPPLQYIVLLYLISHLCSCAELAISGQPAPLHSLNCNVVKGNRAGREGKNKQFWNISCWLQNNVHIICRWDTFVGNLLLGLLSWILSDCRQSTANLGDPISVVIWIRCFHVWVSSRGESPGVLVTFRFLVLPVFSF